MTEFSLPDMQVSKLPSTLFASMELLTIQKMKLLLVVLKTFLSVCYKVTLLGIWVLCGEVLFLINSYDAIEILDES